MGEEVDETEETAGHMHVTVRIPIDLVDAVDAVEIPYRSMSRSAHVREALIDYVNKHSKKEG